MSALQVLGYIAIGYASVGVMGIVVLVACIVIANRKPDVEDVLDSDVDNMGDEAWIAPPWPPRHVEPATTNKELSK